MKHRERASPAEVTAVEAALELRKTRRQVFRISGAVAAFFAALELDKGLTRLIWPSDGSSVDPISECVNLCLDPAWKLPEIWMGAPGMAHKSGLPVARAMAKTALGIPASGRVMSAVTISNRGLTDRTYPNLISQQSSHCDLLSIAGQSMGGVAAIEGARKLNALPGGKLVPLGRIVLFGTPMRMENVREEPIANWLAKVAGVYGGGLAGRSVTNTIKDIRSNRWNFLRNMPAGILNSTMQATEGDSPQIDTTGLALLDDTDLWGSRQSLRGIITPETRGVFVSSDLDDVTNCDMAVEDWGNLFADFGASFEHFQSRPGTGHANVEVGSEELPGWIAQTNKFYQ